MYEFYQETSIERYHTMRVREEFVPEKRLALIYYGLTRSLESVLSSMETHLFQPMEEKKIHVDIFVHTYSIYGEYKNAWSREQKDRYPNVNVIYLLEPSHLIVEKQDDVLARLNIEEYYTKLGNWTGMSEELTKYLIRNMALALYSKKQIALEVEKRMKEMAYDYIMCMRPDLKFTSRFNVEDMDQLDDVSIILPKDEAYSGYNDRFMVAKPSVGLYYCKLFDELLPYSRETSIISEKFLLDMLNKKSIHVLEKDIAYETIRI